MSDKNICPRQHQSPASELSLCRLDDIADGTAKEIYLDNTRTTLCLIRKGTTVFAYANSCPHTGAPLNWGNDQFLTRQGDMIQCAFHGALFRIKDGQCIWGPCLHRRLTAIPVIIRDGNILLAYTGYFDKVTDASNTLAQQAWAIPTPR